MISNSFKFSSCVDLHNQYRQFDLTLEKQWITQDPYFRFCTTVVGIPAIDVWKVSRLQENNDLTIKEYSDTLAADIIDAVKNGGGDSIAVVVEVHVSIAAASFILSMASPTRHTHTKVVIENRK